MNFCTYKDGTDHCDANQAINQTNRILKFENTTGLYINLTCSSIQFIRWVTHVPLVSPAFKSAFDKFYATPFHVELQESVVEGPEPVIREHQQENSSVLTYSLSAQVPLYGLKGRIRCEVSNNSELYAEVFITTGKR